MNIRRPLSTQSRLLNEAAEVIYKPTSERTELQRIISLPARATVDCERRRGPTGKFIYPPSTQALIEVVSEKYRRPRAPGECRCREMGHPCVTQLNAEQAWVLRELPRVGGALGFIPVGGGKSFAGILAPMTFSGVRNAVLLAKSDQRLHYRKSWERLREHWKVPSFVIDGDLDGDPMIVKGAPVLHLIPYSKLSRPESTKLLDDLNPDVIIADECHSLADKQSARTLRFLRFMVSRQGIRFCGWSGTLLDKSIRSVSHLSAFALGTGSPFPIHPGEADIWADVLDPGPQPDRQSPTAKSIFSAFGAPREEKGSVAELFLGLGIGKVRENFGKRMAATPGVITSKALSSTASITVYERSVNMPDNVRRSLNEVRQWVRPDGEELVEAVEQARCGREVAGGFYYFWSFFDELEDLIKKWFRVRKDFNRELREKILRGEEYLDSRNLCERAAQRAWQKPAYEGALPVWKSGWWPAWRDVKDTVRHTQDVEWLDDYLVDDAIKWGNEHRGIIWTMSRVLGRRIAEKGGFNYHGGGIDAEKKILSERGDRSIVVSIKAHREGRDGLQKYFSKQLIVECPSSGKIWGQLLGRLCRPGQDQDEILTWVYVHYLEARESIRKAISQAEFDSDVTTNNHLLLAADFTFDV